ncbi:hypothetical protein DMI62_02665 [Escherichia coli]|nr:hypothetical protein [Escherichia coli]
MPQYATVAALCQARLKILRGLRGRLPDVSAAKTGKQEKRVCCFYRTGPLTDFWRQRDEAEFTGVDEHSGSLLSVSRTAP